MRAAKAVETSCHCGAAKLEVARKPRRLTSCNCSICRRYGALWAYFKPTEVRKKYWKRDVQSYAWGDRSIRFVRCRTCGCVLQWESAKGPGRQIGVTARLMDPAVIANVRIRRLDGARTWKFLD